MLLDHESDNESDYMSYGDDESDSEHGSQYDWSEEEDVEPLGFSRLECEDREGTRQAKACCIPSGFALLPLELVLGICRFLHPWDVLTLARTTKYLRRVLTCKKSINVWKAAWENADGAPACPEDQTHMQWTQLLFGTECTLCWRRYRVQMVLWSLRARPCKECFEAELVSQDLSELDLSQMDEADVLEALKILPRCNETRSREFGEVVLGGVTWLRPAVLATVETLGELRKRQDASKALARFKIKKAAESRAIYASAAVGQEWMLQYRSNKRVIRRKILASKLINLGHEKRDVLPCVARSKRTSEIGENCWETLRPKYEAWMETIKENRLEQEKLKQSYKNRFKARDLGENYQGDQNHFDPFAPENIHDFPGFDGAVGSIAPIDDVTMQVAMGDPPRPLQEWRRKSKMSLLKKIAEGLKFDVLESMTVDQVDEELRQHARSINVVFMCNSGIGPLFLRDIPKHQCLPTKDWMFGCLTFDSKASTTISDTITLAGLDLKTATKEDLDRVNARFICKTCPGTDGSSYARTWRNCIVHAREHDESLLHWTRLDDQTTDMVIEYENLSCKASRMMCLVCPKSTARWGYADKGLERHFQSCHERLPSLGEYVADPRLPTSPMPPVRVPAFDELEAYRVQCDQEHLEFQTKLVENRRAAAVRREQNKVFKCTHCMDLGTQKSSRRFQQAGAVYHVRTVHNVESPLMNKDYYT